MMETTLVTTEAPLGLRERKKAATRRALSEAAVRLAAAHGLEKVTVEAIADSAGVSRRTFSNYFDGKEDALLHGDEAWRDQLVAAFVQRPADEPTWAALGIATRAMFTQITVDPILLRQTRLVRRHPSLVPRHLARFAELENALAEVIAQRDGLAPDTLRARIIAAAYLMALRVATQRWADDDEQPLPDLVEEALAETGRAFDA